MSNPFVPTTLSQLNPKPEVIVKPAMSVVLLSLPLFWLGLIIAEKLCWYDCLSLDANPSLPASFIFGGILFYLALVIRSRHNHLVLAGLILFSLFSGVVVGYLYWLEVRNGGTALAIQCQAEIELKIISDPRQGMYSQTSEAIVNNANHKATKVRLFWPSDIEAQPLGTIFKTNGSYVPLDDRAEWIFQKGMSSSLRIDGLSSEHFEAGPIGIIERMRLQNSALMGRFAGVGSDLLRGVVLGDTTSLQNSDLDRDFKLTGLSHLIAVSGGHLMIIAALTCWCTARMRISHLIEFSILAILLCAYVVLTGLQASAIRSCVMTLVASFSWFIGRRQHAPSALGFTALVMLALNPANAFSLGFALSVFAVLGLCLFAPLVQGWLYALSGSSCKRTTHVARIRSTIVEPFALTITAQIATLPLTLPTFALLSLIAPLANLIVTPLISLMIAGGIVVVGISFFSTEAAAIPLSFLCKIGDLTAAAVHWLASLPGVALPITIDGFLALAISALLFILIRLFWPQPHTSTARVALIIIMGTLFLFNHTLTIIKTPTLVMMDVGQGDALLVRGRSQTILIDTGEHEADLLKALARQGVRHLDAVVITHLDSDHCGALSALRGTVSVDHVYFADGLSATQDNEDPLRTAAALSSQLQAESLRYKDRFELGSGLSLTMVAPRVSVAKGNNEESICLYLEYDSNQDSCGDIQVLLTGDAEAEVLDVLLDTGFIRQATILKVGHHGSSGAVTSQQLRELDTRVALISVGADNRFGHPATEVVRALENQGIRIYRTDINGDVTITMHEDGFTVRCDTMIDAYD
ncbi:MAG: DNA internalization-related competence protein ComEC/Rec2 [Coriobacteriaceae bacterium]|nr:DNA internalization-related competence protein ComEC/Rec2 [Coriobacteriaceae bacterium]